MIRRKLSSLGIQAAVLAAAWAGLAPAQAHHASANFDNSKTYSFRATVKKFLWANPHTWLYAVVTKPNGSQELWGFEGGGTNMLIRNGWSAADPKPGERWLLVTSAFHMPRAIAAFRAEHVPARNKK